MKGLDLPTIWAGILAIAVFLYVLLDGFDLGVGILFPFARSPSDRDVMMNTIAPVWDGNETWLVLGGGGLLAAFPAAYAVVMPALYLPVTLMLAGLILRGVAFEFRGRGRARGRRFWTIAFAAGSMLATVAQGCVLGGFLQGVKVAGGQFAGGAFDWLSPYTLLVAAGLVAGYALLGAAWIMLKSQDELHGDARRWTGLAATVTAAILAAVSIATLWLHPQIAERWGLAFGRFDASHLLVRLPVPLLGAVGLAVVWRGVQTRSHHWPFIGAALLFISGYLGLALSLAPYLVPYTMTAEQAAAAPNALGLMLVGVGVLLPLILGYTGFVYFTFRGKVTADAGYH